MTIKMTRRTFLKGAAAAAAAVSLSGLLTGCGDQELPDNEIQIGAYTVKVYDLDVDQGTEMNKAGAILGKVKLRFADGGGNWQTMRYDGMFSATVNGCNLTQVAPTGRFTVTDSMGGKLHSTVEQELRLSFPNEGWRYQYQNGAVAVLTKFFENGTAERAKESGTEQNYNMIDGCVNNVPKKPRRIGGRWSVLDRLHIKQAERRQKDNTPQQEQERSRKS